MGLNNGYSETWNVSDNKRCFGLYGGPYEAGTVLNILSAYVITNNTKITKNALLMIMSAMILLTQSRISIMAQIVLFFLYIFKSSRKSNRLLISCCFICFSLITIFLVQNIRAHDKSSIFNIHYIVNQIKSIEIEKDNISLSEIKVDDNSGVEASWQIRFSNWVTVIKLILSNPFALLIGFSPGAFGIALDGGWVRLFVEYGMVGIVWFNKFLKDISATSPFGIYLSFIFSINMIFADSFISYKAMCIFLATSSYLSSYEKKQSLKRNTE
jgi:hypothetical protein